MSTVEIILSNSTRNYLAGQEIQGTIRCHCNSEKTITGIKIRLSGKELTSWRKNKTTYGAIKKFLNSENNLIDGTRKLSEGTYNYPFSLYLPNDISSTYKILYGRIYYKIKVVVKRLGKIDLKTEMTVNVISLIDLNTIPVVKFPVEYSSKKHGGELTMVIKLPRLGYAPGEDIEILAYIENLSNQNINSIKFKLYEEIDAIGKSPTHKQRVRSCLEKIIERICVGAHSKSTFLLKLPISNNFVPVNFNNCKLFTVKYYLKCKVVDSSLFFNSLAFTIPLRIGHVGLGKVVTSVAHTTSNSFLSSNVFPSSNITVYTQQLGNDVVTYPMENLTISNNDEAPPPYTCK